MSTTYAGRSRQSIADIEEHLNEIFQNHPDSHPNDSGDPVIPADALVDVFRAFSESYNGVELMTNDEMDLLKMLLATNPGLEVTPQTLLGFIAEKTRHSPRESPKGSPHEGDVDLPDRGRSVGRDNGDERSRSSSRDSTGTLSRPPSVPPKTPTSGNGFDSSRRQRSTPLNANAPSSWTKRPAPANRRKSIDGSNGRALSDSESSSPSSFGRTPARTRAPSNPTSPGFLSSSTSSLGSPPFSSGSISRPHSRTHSYPMPPPSYVYGSPDRDLLSGRILSPQPPDLDMSYEYQRKDAAHDSSNFLSSVSSLPMPRSAIGSDSDSEDDEDADSSLGLVLDRSAASSTVSLEPMDRLDALQRANAELGRKLMDAERTLQNKLSDHESELEEMQGRLEEARIELSATKREEKELRSKERQNSTQISALESEIGKLQKSLDNARASYQSLQKQYQEQCSESERYRNTLRRRDQEIKDYQEAAALQAIENHKYIKEHDNYEERIAFIEAELSIAQQASAQLDEQKQENLMLKETIDRMRYDMDEMRNNAASAAAMGGSGQTSTASSMSKSLGAELLGQMTGAQWEKMKGTQWGIEGEDGEDGGEGENEGESAQIIDVDSDGEETESEDVVQTIITRKTRKVPGRANKIEMVSFQETKEYSDAYTQHEPAGFTASTQAQTDPEPKILRASFNIQTDDPPTEAFGVQTEPEPLPPPKVTLDMEIQTEEPEVSRSPSPDEAMTSSSSTVVPSTPKPVVSHIPSDLPPAYNQVTEQDKDDQKWRVAAETLKHWHNGVSIPFEPIPGGVSEDAVETWKALQEELGIGCMVIDKVIATSEKTDTPPRPTTKDGKRRSKFYNIYNTYVYGHGKDGPPSFPKSFVSQVAVCMGASAFVVLILLPYVVPAYYQVPGGPTYQDRSAWHAFNSLQATGEGFSPDGAGAIWNFLDRIGGVATTATTRAARIARGWPT